MFVAFTLSPRHFQVIVRIAASLRSLYANTPATADSFTLAIEPFQPFADYCISDLAELPVRHEAPEVALER